MATVTLLGENDMKTMLDYVKQGESGPDGFTVLFPPDFDVLGAARKADAADEMLEALRRVQKALADYRDGLRIDEGSLEELKYLVVDAAIAKAEGRTP